MINRLLDARSELFFIERMFTIFERIGDGGGRVPDARVDVIFDGDMYSEGVRVHVNDTRAFVKISEITFLATFD